MTVAPDPSTDPTPPVRPLTAGDRRRRRERRLESARGLGLTSLPVLLVALFVGLPIVVAIGYSVGQVGGLNSTVALIARDQHTVEHWYQATFGAYRDLFDDARFRRDLVATVVLSAAATVITIVLAWAIALYVRLSDTWVARTLSALAVVPMFVPVVISAWAILTFYAADGFIRSVLDAIGLHDGPIIGYTLVCVLIGLVWTSLPFATLMVVSGVQSVPNALIDAARDSGASMARTIRSVIAPMALVPTVIAATFTAIGTLGSFTVPYLTGPNAPNMLGVDMANYFQAFNQPQASVSMAVVVFVIAGGIGAVYVWANFRAQSNTARGPQ